MRSFTTIVACILSASVSTSSFAADKKRDRKRAIQLFRESETAYQAGEFERAANLLREAYDLDPAPTLLYNLARALESSGDLPAAKKAYEEYIQVEPKAKDRPAIEKRIENLGRQIRERQELEARLKRKAEEDAEAKAVEPPPAPPVVATTQPPPDPPAASPIPWIVAGLGVAVVGSGAVLGALARGRNNDAIAAPLQTDAAALADEAQGLATAANVSFAVGGAVVAGGLLWGLLTLGDDTPKDATTFVPVVGPSYAGVSAQF